MPSTAVTNFDTPLPAPPARVHYREAMAQPPPTTTAEREHRPSDAFGHPRPVRRASSPPPAPRPSRLRQTISRYDSSASDLPSVERRRSVDRRSVESAPSQIGSRPPPKKQRPRPANLGGPTLSAVPRNIRLDPSDRAPSSSGGSYYGSSESGDRDGKEGKESKPVYAIGGVLPKHEGPRKRKESAVAKEKEKERGGSGSSADRQSSGDGGVERKPSTRARRLAEEDRYQSYSSGAIASDSHYTSEPDVVNTPEEYVSKERSDPFEDLRQPPVISRPSQRSRRSRASRKSVSQEPAPPPEQGSPKLPRLNLSEERPAPSLHDSEVRERTSTQLGEGSRPSDETVIAADTAVGEEPTGDIGEKPLSPVDELSDAYSTHSASDDDEDDDDERTQHSDHDEHDEGPPRDKHEDKNNWPKEADGEQGQVGGELNQDTEDWEDDFDRDDDDLPIRNTWGTIRFALREPLAEFLGTLVLVVIGVGADCQTKISENTQGTTESMNFSWGFATMASIYVAGGISGGHTNPAVTLMLAVFRGFPWKMVPRYIFAQVFGAFCGALIIYGNYMRAIHSYDPNKLITGVDGLNASATLFITAPASQVGNTVEGFCQEVLASAILSIGVLALGDENNAPPGAGLGAIVLGFLVCAIGMSNGWISGYAINWARDFGPRLALWCVGYGTKLWTHNDAWWFCGAFCGPLVGSLSGALAYDLCIFTGSGSPVNYSGEELKNAIGVPMLHNMVRLVTDPHYRHRRMAAARTQDPEALQSSGMVPAELVKRTVQPPGRLSNEGRNELELNRRFQRGRDKIERRDARSISQHRKEQERRNKSIEALREKMEKEGAVPASEYSRFEKLKRAAAVPQIPVK